MDGKRLRAPIERLMAAGDGLALDDEGLDRLQQMAEEHPGALILLDSYDALVSPLGNEEASSLFARPARLLMDLCSAYRGHMGGAAPHQQECERWQRN